MRAGLKMAKKDSERIGLTNELIFDLCGGDGHNSQYLDFVYRGLHELNSKNGAIGRLYQYLNLDELLVFARDSWLMRARNSLEHKIDPKFELETKQKSIYEILSDTFKEDSFQHIDGFYNGIVKTGFGYFAKRRLISEKNERKYQRFNPYQPETLEARLNLFESEEPKACNEIKELLSKPVMEYVFECQYQNAKMARCGSNQGISIYSFQPVYPNKEVNSKNFANQIRKYISSYPKEIVERERYNPISEDKPEGKKDEGKKDEAKGIGRGYPADSNNSEAGQLPLF